jgi:hypothetical protein
MAAKFSKLSSDDTNTWNNFMKKRIIKTTNERILDSKLSKQFLENPNGYDLGKL